MNQPKTMKLTDRIVGAIAMYYANRALQFNQEGHQIDETYVKFLVRNKKRAPWNKVADENNVMQACKGTKWGFASCCGTFWFTKKDKDGKVSTYKVNENTFPVAEYEGTYDPKTR